MAKGGSIWLRLICFFGGLAGAGVIALGAAQAPSQSASALPASASVPDKAAASQHSPSEKYGAIAGRIRDNYGRPQPGIAVDLIGADGHIVTRAVSGPEGKFEIGALSPGSYTAQVIEPSFVPFLKPSVRVVPGAVILLNIDLLSLAGSMRLSFPIDLQKAADDWKWVLRSDYPTRPILRFEETAPSPAATRDPRERALSGTVQLAAGNEAHGFGQNPGLRTAFEMAYAAHRSQRFGLAGSAGWEHGTPAASFRATWDKNTPSEGRSSFSVAVRQLFLPGEYWVRSPLVAERTTRVSSATLAYEQEKTLPGNFTIQYGSLFDVMTLGGRMSRWSPFTRLSFAPSTASLFQVYYAAANPRVLPADWNPDHRNEEQWLAIPQVGAGETGRPTLEGGRHVEASWEQLIGRVRVQSAVFYDVATDSALSLAFTTADMVTDGLLRDPFSDRFFLSAGRTASPGARVAAAAKLSRDAEVVVGYSYSPALRADSDLLSVEEASSLRGLIHGFRAQSLSLKVNSRMAWTGTRLSASYRWLPSRAVSAPDAYDRGLAKADPYLNLLVQQPLPSPEILPGTFEAVADFSNLLAQGYVGVHTSSGSHGFLFPSARSFRGGFNYIF